MKTDGVHLLCELSGCNPETLANAASVRQTLESAAAAAHATVLNAYFHQFSPSGISGVLCLAESHISIHTWPEYGYAAADIFTCGESTQPQAAIQLLKQALSAKETIVREITRGAPDAKGCFTNRDKGLVHLK